VARRITGGGAVYHDLENLNFSFTVDEKGGMDFRKYTEPILEALCDMGINAAFEGRNDLTIDGKKFSGNAACSYKGRILHHGTLLFNSKMETLGQALKANPLKFKDKSVKSVQSRVTNIAAHLPKPMTVEEFAESIMQHILKKYPQSERYQFSGSDIAQIEHKVAEKFGTWEWNFGNSPQYQFQKMARTGGGTLEIDMNIEKGVIQEIRIFGDFFGDGDTQDIEKLLVGTAHEEAAIRNRLASVNWPKYFVNISLDEFVSTLF